METLVSTFDLVGKWETIFCVLFQVYHYLPILLYVLHTCNIHIYHVLLKRYTLIYYYSIIQWDECIKKSYRINHILMFIMKMFCHYLNCKIIIIFPVSYNKIIKFEFSCVLCYVFSSCCFAVVHKCVLFK